MIYLRTDNAVRGCHQLSSLPFVPLSTSILHCPTACSASGSAAAAAAAAAAARSGHIVEQVTTGAVVAAPPQISVDGIYLCWLL